MNPWRSRHRNDRLIFHLSDTQMTHLDRRVAAGSLRGCTHANQSVRLERLRSTQLQCCAALATVFFLSGQISKRVFRYRNFPSRTPVELFLCCSALQSCNASFTGLLKITKKNLFLQQTYKPILQHEIQDANMFKYAEREMSK